MSDLEDDSWADTLQPAAKRPRALEPAEAAAAASADAGGRPGAEAEEAELDDYWVDGPARPTAAAASSSAGREAPGGARASWPSSSGSADPCSWAAAPEFEDAWADGPRVRRPATKPWNREPKVPPPGAGELEDDSWADGPPRRKASGALQPKPMRPEDAVAFIREVLELMLRYQPPAEKRPSVLQRHIPEPFWVPAKDILNAEQLARLAACIDRADSIDTCQSEEDGLMLRMTRHPRAADDMAHLDRCAERLASDLGLGKDEARSMLNQDSKFMEFWGALRVVEAKSPEEAHLERTLRARTKILTDARQVSADVLPLASWTEVRNALEKVKRYRQVLSAWLATGSQDAEEQLQACLEAIVEAWPDVKLVDGGKKVAGAKQEGDKGEGKAKDKEASKGKGKDKGRGKSKG